MVPGRLAARRPGQSVLNMGGTTEAKRFRPVIFPLKGEMAGWERPFFYLNYFFVKG